MKIPCGCRVNLVKGTILLFCLKRGWIKLFDLVHGGVV